MVNRAVEAAYKTLLIFNTILIVMFLFSPLLDNPVVFASFAASVFILFIHPHSEMASPKNLVGGHMIAAFLGFGLASVAPAHLLPISGAFAVGLASLLMVLLKLEHAPAAATALSFSYNFSGISSYESFLVVLVMIASLAVIKILWLFGVRLWHRVEK
jgi:CBS-domain-containing membrane protein